MVRPANVISTFSPRRAISASDGGVGRRASVPSTRSVVSRPASSARTSSRTSRTAANTSWRGSGDTLVDGNGTSSKWAHTSVVTGSTREDAARASHEAGLKVLMVAPNVVRGGSHSGNIAARDVADEGLLDVLSSDYVPFSLIHAVFALSDGHPGMRLP